mgnify:FL=1
MSYSANTFEPPLLASNAHAQTLWRRFTPLAVFEQFRERIELADGDFIDIDWAGPAPSDSSRHRIVVLLHGLCGSSQSPYIIELQRELALSSVASVALNFRGCSGEFNRLARAYHSGVTEDLDEVFNILQEQYPAHHFLFAGYSLGASVLLNWLAEKGEKESHSTAVPASSTCRAVAVSTPFQLADCSRAMLGGTSAFYGDYFVKLLNRDFINKVEHLETLASLGNPLAFDAATTLRGLLNNAVDLTSIWRFDDQLTAPLHGFANADDYYARCSSGPKLKRINARTLLIQSADDPLIPPAALPSPEDLGSATELQLSDRGGHVGFIARGNRAWLEQQIARFLLSSD